MESSRYRATLGVAPLVGLFLLLFAVYWLSATGRFSVPDHRAVYATAEALVERGSLAIAPITFVAAQGQDGQHYSISGVGLSLVSAPLYLLGRTVEAVSSPALRLYWSGPAETAHGVYPGSVPIYFVSLANQILTPLLAILVLLCGLRLGFTPAAALAVTLAFALGTFVWVHARDYFQHTLETLLLFGAVYVLFSRRDDLRAQHALLAGVLFGGAILTRFQVMLCLPVVGAYLFCLLSRGCALALPERSRIPLWRSLAEWPPSLTAWLRLGPAQLEVLVRRWHLLALFLAPIALVMGLQLGWNHVRFGNLWDSGYARVAIQVYGHSELFLTPLWVGLYGFLFSPGKSLLLFAPPLLLTLFALPAFWRRQPLEALLFGGITLVYVGFYARYSWYDGGIGWGPRYLLPLVPFWVVPIGYLLTTRRNWLLFGGLTAFGAAIQFLGVVVDNNPLWWPARFNPSMAFRYLPEWWPPLTQWEALQRGGHADLWFVRVLHQFGWATFLSTLLLPLLLALEGLLLLRPHPMAPADERREARTEG